VQQGSVQSAAPQSFSWFGASVALSGGTAVVGAFGNLGSADIFTTFDRRFVLGFEQEPGGGSLIHFTGIPGNNYALERAVFVTGPWNSVMQITVAGSGSVDLRDANPPSSMAFYRVRAQ
jgi:hypothetical protein